MLKLAKMIIISAILAAAMDPAVLASDEVSALKMSKDYCEISVSALRRIHLSVGYHEGLFYDGKNIWVCNGKKGKIWIIDAADEKVISNIEPISVFTEGITGAPGGRFYATDWDEERLYIARLEGNKMVEESSVSLAPAHPTGVIYIGSRLFVITWTHGMGTKFDILEMDGKLNIKNKIAVKRIEEPAHMAWDGKNLWITSWYSRMVYKVDIDTWEILGFFNSPVSQATGIAWDGKYLWLTGTHGDLYKLEIL